MKNNKNQYKYLILYLLIIISGCKAINTDIDVTSKPIPSRYHSSAKDSFNIADINWRSYFEDTILIQLIDSAITGNQDLQLCLQRIELARAQVKTAKGALLPQIGMNINGGVRKYGLYTMDGAGNITTEITPGQIVPIDLPDMYLGLNASWEVDIWGKLRNQRKSALANYFATLEVVNFVISNLVADVSTAYYELLALDNELDIIQQTTQNQKAALDAIKLQKEVGKTNEMAVKQFHAQLLNTQALELETKQQITEQENLINFLLGRYPQAIKRNNDFLLNELPKQIGSGIPSNLLSNRPDIREAELRIQASKFDLKAAKAAFYPNLNITAGMGFQAFNPKYLFNKPASLAYSALGGLVAPLINLNALKSQFKTARSGQISAMLLYQQSILNAYVEVVNELSNIENLSQIRLLKEQQHQLLSETIEVSEELLMSGKANYLEVLLAQQNSLETRLELNRVYLRQRIAAVNLYKLLGGGW